MPRDTSQNNASSQSGCLNRVIMILPQVHLRNLVTTSPSSKVRFEKSHLALLLVPKALKISPNHSI